MNIDIKAKDLRGLLPDADLDRIPNYMQDGVYLYLLRGIQPGHFLTAVLSNDLREAVARADDINRWKLVEWVQFFFNYAPSASWGSKEKVVAWLKSGGLMGQLKEADNDEQ